MYLSPDAAHRDESTRLDSPGESLRFRSSHHSHPFVVVSSVPVFCGRHWAREIDNNQGVWRTGRQRWRGGGRALNSAQFAAVLKDTTWIGQRKREGREREKGEGRESKRDEMARKRGSLCGSSIVCSFSPFYGVLSESTQWQINSETGPLKIGKRSCCQKKGQREMQNSWKSM